MIKYEYDNLDLEYKKELAKYMLGDWEFDNSEESNYDLERELDKYIEKNANGKSYSFKKTPPYDIIDFLEENVYSERASVKKCRRQVKADVMVEDYRFRGVTLKSVLDEIRSMIPYEGVSFVRAEELSDNEYKGKMTHYNNLHAILLDDMVIGTLEFSIDLDDDRAINNNFVEGEFTIDFADINEGA